MQRIYIFIILFISSCASVGDFPEDTNETSIDRATRCYYENINEYWGDCWIQESKQEPSFYEWVEYLDMSESWTMLQKLNEKLIKGIDYGQYNNAEANNIFGQAVTDIDAIVSAKIQTNVEIAEQRRQQIATALLAVGSSISEANQNYYKKQDTAKKIGTTYFLSNQYVSGAKRICVYKLGSFTATHTIPGVDICPSSMEF